MAYPLIIQGGMGVGVSSWRLAKAVAQMGQLGVVSGIGLGEILARRLQLGDPGGHFRRAMGHFPVPEIAQKVRDKFFVQGGKAEEEAFKRTPMFTLNPVRGLQELTVVANFVEVFLAKEGHNGLVGINYLESIQLPNLYSLYGVMLADVDYVLMGAGIPREIPGVLDRLANHEEASLHISVVGATSGDNFQLRFNPKDIIQKALPRLKRPKFLGIIASVTLAQFLAKKATGKVDGFVIEGPTAGGHNAPPRGKLTLNERGEPAYGERDEVDLEKITRLGLPFWLAGSYAAPEKLKEALELGAKGVQVGTAFAFCRESALSEEIKEKLLAKALRGEAEVFTDPKASPTGFPFKVVSLEGTVSEDNEYQGRPRSCDVGYLRHPYRKEDGAVGFRCPSEPTEAYVKKGGNPTDVEGRKCLCNGLLSNIGLPQLQKSGYIEKPLVTAGDDARFVARFLNSGNPSYSAEDVIRHLLSFLE
ncbi:MAG: nitronate monooxygenase [Nitrospinae bacterium]|nr:nitronate monooxygenase [Nitrospinota bacterium]